MPPVSVTARPFWARLAANGERPALVTATRTWSYSALAVRVAALASQLGPTRRLVVVESGNTVDTVVAYLAALAGGHPVILAPAAEAVAGYDPDVVIRGDDVAEVRSATQHDLHPDLALLLSTSGSTGSPKLVRLSHTNLSANATAIAAYLQIRPTDVAPTSLPLHYCYGLSVLNSHLVAGAAVLLTEESVAAPEFWDQFRSAGCTSLAGVPYTFALLDRIGFDGLELPTLRYLTQAGGRLEPESVRRYAELGLQRGFDLFVMYGQTEATARMAYLPPDLALSSPEAVGVPIPGGELTLADDGELVYRGDNVMLGYATGPADLAAGRELDELHTGDLGRLRADGLYEITGRKARIAKVYGLRVDLDRVEKLVAAAGTIVHCADAGDRLVAAVDTSARPASPDLAHRVAASSGLPVGSVQVVALEGVPRLPSGKPDFAEILTLAAGSPGDPGEPPDHADLTTLYAKVLRREHVTADDSFVSLQGDSLSYVEMSLRLEAALGSLPADWPTRPIRDLAPLGPKRRRGRSVETNVLLRAVAIVAIVGSHSNLFTLLGGAHVLVGLAGYNFARFHLTARPRIERVKHLASSIARIVVPSMVWLTFAAITSWKYGVLNVFLLNGLFGSRGWTESWHYWFIEMLVYTLVVLGVLLALPSVDRWERRWPFWLPFGLALVALLTRYDVVTFAGGDRIHRAHVIFWLFALGWATAKSRHWRDRALVTLVLVLTVPGFFVDDPARDAVVLAGLLLLVWVPSVRLPAPITAPMGLLATASLYIYLCHWQVYPYWENTVPLAATLLSLAAGLALWWVVTRLSPYVELRALEIGNNLRRLTPRRYATSDPGPRPAAAPRGDDQPAHVAA